jgi:6-phosphogluconate dehydrogenase
MRIGMVGLGRMGANMSRRLAAAGIDIVAFDASDVARAALDGTARVTTVPSLDALVTALGSPALPVAETGAHTDVPIARPIDTPIDTPTAGPSAGPAHPAAASNSDTAVPRIVWTMLPAGGISQATIDRLAESLEPGDIVIDGANAWYKDSVRRAKELASRGIGFIDAGVSGGVWGLANGYALMIGGDAAAVDRASPLFRALAPGPDRGWLHCGPAGAGHFVKMIHNGIEYGMMQAYAEGLSMLRGKSEFDIDIAAVAEMWRHGSVVRSWLLDLTADALKGGTALDHVKPFVADSGEGRWTAIEAVEQGIPAPVMSLALMMRFASQGTDDYGSKLLALMRAGFGGHAVQHLTGEHALPPAGPSLNT